MYFMYIQNVMMYVLQFNVNNEHKFRRLVRLHCCYISFMSAYDAWSDRLWDLSV